MDWAGVLLQRKDEEVELSDRDTNLFYGGYDSQPEDFTQERSMYIFFVHIFLWESFFRTCLCEH